jgi:YD repeat-containing protein
MKRHFIALAFLAVATLMLQAQSSREVVRDSSGRLVHTIEHRKDSSGTIQSITRDAAGRLVSTATTRPGSGGGSSTQTRDSSGRLICSAITNTSGNASNTTYRNSSGRLVARAETRTSGQQTTTRFQDASGRSSGSSDFSNSSGTRRDASGRLVNTHSGSRPSGVPSSPPKP